jgi:hypothetical protein
MGRASSHRDPTLLLTVPVRHRVREFDGEFEQDLKLINRSQADAARCVQRATKKSGDSRSGQIGFDGYVAICAWNLLGDCCERFLIAFTTFA